MGHVLHCPPQPSGPHITSLQSGIHTHCPSDSHSQPASHWPQLLPQPSAPQVLLSHCGMQGPVVHFPASQRPPSGHAPQVAPHPSGPQCWSAHCGMQRHWASAVHTSPGSHWPHAPSQPSGPQALFSHSGWQTHNPFRHCCMTGHCPQLPPQPSMPHSFPLQLGEHWTQVLYWQPNWQFASCSASTPHESNMHKPSWDSQQPT